MRVELSKGDELVVTIEGADGEFRILYDVRGDNKLRVLANLPDDKNRGGDEDLNLLRKPGTPKCDPEIYCESFGVHDEVDEHGNHVDREYEDETHFPHSHPEKS